MSAHLTDGTGTGVTFWLLHRDREAPGTLRLAIPIGLLFVLWVNCDVWFFLGPVLLDSQSLPSTESGGSSK